MTYSQDINLYLVRTSEYLEETEAKAMLQDGSLELCQGLGKEFINQFVNARKVREVIKKTGATVIRWIKRGQTDYRMAMIHSFICLDIPTEVGTFRRELNKDDFIYNPIQKSIESSVQTKQLQKQKSEEEKILEEIGYKGDNNSYDVGSFSSGSGSFGSF